MRRPKAISVLAVIALSRLIVPSHLAAGGGDQTFKIITLSEKCKSGKQGACKDLAKIALNDPDAKIRESAVFGLTDQSLLAKIATEDKEINVRSSAVAAMTDQALLAKFAVEDKDVPARFQALWHLTDQALLAKIAVDDTEESVRRQAKRMLGKYMIDAADRGDEVAVQSLLDRGADVDSRDQSDFTALMRASMKGQLGVVKILLAKGASIDAGAFDSDYVQMPNGAKAYPGTTTTAAQIASMTGGVVVRGNKNTALSLASANGHPEIKELLVKAGAK